MIDSIKKNLIFSSLHLFTKNKRGNFSKMNNSKLLIFSEKLKNNNFDGWISSINNKTNIEITLLNNKNLYSLYKSEKLNENWINSNYINNKLISKNWGKNYPIYVFQIVLNNAEIYYIKGDYENFTPFYISNADFKFII